MKQKIKNNSIINHHGKSSLFFKMMMLMVAACLLTALLSAVLYYNFGIRVYGKRMADEMMPRALSIARVSERYLRGRMDFDSYRSIILDDHPLGTRVYIYDDQGNLFAQSVYKNNAHQEEPPVAFREYVNQILTSGENISYSNSSIDGRNKTMIGVVVGVPIKDNIERVCGAVLLTKPSNELHSAMTSMLIALLLSSLIVFIVLTILAFLVSRRFAKPIQSMTDIAVAMASGDFSTKADTNVPGEIGQLGSALNFLSEELSKSIGELTLTRDRLTTTLTGMNEGVISLDTEQKITFFNPASERLLGKQTLHMPLNIPSASDFKTEIQDLCAQVLADGNSKETLFQRGDNILQFTITRVLASYDKLPGMIMMIRDVTEAERLEQTRRDYVANVSHELRTPIASIRSLAETLNDGMVKDEEGRSRYYGHILRESMRLSRLIDDLLELSRLQSGTIALTKQTFQLSDLLSEVAERVRINAEYSGIGLEYESQDLPLVCSNPDRIEQVLVALTDNAVKYTCDGGRILLYAHATEDHIVVDIRNTGHISHEDLPHLFDRFYKADKAHSGQGTGLGLAITKELLHLLGETVEVRNDGDDVVFSFTVAIANKN